LPHSLLQVPWYYLKKTGLDKGFDFGAFRGPVGVLVLLFRCVGLFVPGDKIDLG
jgi:hypothetical protein